MATAEITPQIEQAQEAPREVPTSLSEIENQERQRGAEFQDHQRSERAAQEQQEAADGEEANSRAEVDSEAEADELGLDKDDSQLPKEQQKSYTRELMKHYAQRFGFSEEDLQDQRIRDIVKSKIDTDIYANTLKAERAAEGEETEEAEAEDGEENQEEQTEEQKAETERQAAAEEAQRASQQQQAAPLDQQAYAQQMERVRGECFDPRMNHPEAVEMYVQHLAPLFGAADGDPEKMNNMRQAVHATVLGVHNQIRTAVPMMVEAIVQERMSEWLDGHLPGIASMHNDALLHNTWVEVCKGFPGLPAFGTPEFYEAAESVHKANPWLANLDMKDAKGRPLPILEALHAKATLTAKLLSGEKISPQSVQKAIDKARVDDSRRSRRVTAGRTLGTGKPTGQMEKSEGLAGGSIMAAYRERNNGGF